MRRMIAFLVFAIVGTLGVFAQNGTVTQTFYMDYDTKRIDTCTVAMSFVKGVPTEVSIYFNHEDRKNYMVAFIYGTPNMYHKYKTVEQRINDFRSLLETMRDKLDGWGKIARENKVVSYSKEIGNFDKTPILSLNAYVNGIRYYQKGEPPYVTGCIAYYKVDKNGKSFVSMTWGNPRFERTIGYNEGLLSSRPIKEQFVKQKLWFQFSSVHDIQSLIDALDIVKVKQKLLKNTESNKDLDSLFK